MVFIKACFRQPTPYTPIWMMRQAGRYLSEYRQTRAKAKNFLALCKDVDLAAQITMQPIDILDVDAAILFSDILVLPHEMGMELEFNEGSGPRFLNPLKTQSDLKALKGRPNLDYVCDTIAAVRSRLDKSKALIGFSGAPWTLATYMIEGSGSKQYEKSKRMLYANPAFMHDLLSRLSQELKFYLCAQIKAGADCIMLFDSWAGALESSAYLEFGWHYIQEIVSFVKREYPKTPIIVFPRGVSGLARLKGDFEVLGIDYNTDLLEAKAAVGSRFVLQGNLEPARLYDYDAMASSVQSIIGIMQNKGHIFNLGAGMLKDLPRENAIALVKLVRELSSAF